jgi:hypothetical protein
MAFSLMVMLFIQEERKKYEVEKPLLPRYSYFAESFFATM